MNSHRLCEQKEPLALLEQSEHSILLNYVPEEPL